MASTTAAPVQPVKTRKEKTREKNKLNRERARERKEKEVDIDKKGQEREHRRTSSHQNPPTERFKIVVRKLPPNLPEEIFWQSVQTWVTDESVTWKAYYPGKLRAKGTNKENISSRAYIAFKDEDQLTLFSKEYDGHLFRDKSGNEFQAVVEFAPYQKVPSGDKKKKVDARNGTIEKDEDYISFIESLAAAKDAKNNEPVSIEALIASTQPLPQPKTTPLLEALKAEKAEKEKAQAEKAAAAAREKEKLAKVAIMARKEKEDLVGGKKKGGKPESAPSSKKGSSSKKPASSSAPTTAPHPKSAASKSEKSASRQGAAPPLPPSKVLSKPSASSAANPTSSPISVSASSETQTQADPSGASSPVPTNTAPRRNRPILGLASRQFEAALSGAGVAPGERKSRREREKEREAVNKEKDSQSALASSINDNSSTGAGATAIPPISPKRDRGGRKGSIGSGPPKVPSILQRPSAPTDSTPVSESHTTPAEPGPGPGQSSSRGGRRGRGGGRGGSGRGGPPRPG